MSKVHPEDRGNPVVWGILAAILTYAAALYYQLPQQWTDAVVSAHAGAHAGEAASHAVAGESIHSAVDAVASAAGAHPAEHATRSHGEGHGSHGITAPPVWTIAPFVALLGAIALFPLLHKTEHWWEENINRFKVAASLGLLTLGYYAFLHHGAIEAHWPAHAVVGESDGAFQLGFVKAILGNAILSEYIPFIVLLFSLYTIAGGIRIEGDLQANPLTNASFMLAGGLLASFIGTTGAAMLLIRPLLETNKERKHVSHTVVFFIFVVCNCGGCLLPIGDPPLFLGYLEGVSFTWTLGLWREWLFVNGLLLLVYCALDQLFFYRRESLSDIKRDVTQTRRLRISGAAINGPLLMGVVLAVALLDPTKTIPGTNWHPWMYFREIVQLGLVAASLGWGARKVRQANEFNYAAIIEVAALFIGIFVCMQPALQILGVQGAALVERFNLGPAEFFWATGGLSSFLDNAPTYLVFFKTVQDPSVGGVTGGVPAEILAGISLGSVFMGAMTYIGNGPNFMVKAIAEKSGVRMPSFFGYMLYSCLILLPILALSTWQFLS
jgi:Na+/H+ antiporter NhaD/arsenite permease-like protein